MDFIQVVDYDIFTLNQIFTYFGIKLFRIKIEFKLFYVFLFTNVMRF